MNEKRKFILVFLSAVVAGTAISILFAPDKTTEPSSKIKQKHKKFKSKSYLWL